MIKEFKTGKAEGLFAEVPFASKGVAIIFNDTCDYTTLQFDNPHIVGGKYTKLLPKFDYKYLCATSSTTEEDAKKIVDYIQGYGHKDYTTEYNGSSSPFDVWASAPFKSTIESLHSLIQSLNLDASKNYAVLIKVKQ